VALADEIADVVLVQRATALPGCIGADEKQDPQRWPRETSFF